jgi:hypothetical protein
MRPGDRQHGWIGLVVLLVVLLIVAVLGQRMLRAFGVTAAPTDGKAASRSAVDAAREPGVASDTSTTVTPGNAMERARGVEATIQKQDDETSKRIDDQSK